MSLLITRPKYDKATHYLYFWVNLIIDEAKRRGVKFFDLEKKKANRKNVESYVKAHQPKIIIFNGHGHNRGMFGHDDEEIVDLKNSSIFKGSTVHMRACSAGRILGQEIVNQGADCFIGYREPFLFYTKPESLKDPIRDSYAMPFFEASNQIGISLIKGKNGPDSHVDSIEVYRKWIRRLCVSDAENSFVLPALVWNMQHQVCLTKK